MRTTLNLAPDVRSLLRRERARRGTTMTALLEEAVRSVYGPKRQRTKRQLVRENGYLIVAALPGERLINDSRVKEALQEMEW